MLKHCFLIAVQKKKKKKEGRARIKVLLLCSTILQVNLMERRNLYGQQAENYHQQQYPGWSSLLLQLHHLLKNFLSYLVLAKLFSLRNDYIFGKVGSTFSLLSVSLTPTFVIWLTIVSIPWPTLVAQSWASFHKIQLLPLQLLMILASINMS